jgi:hypothetical protein
MDLSDSDMDTSSKSSTLSSSASEGEPESEVEEISDDNNAIENFVEDQLADLLAESIFFHISFTCITLTDRSTIEKKDPTFRRKQRPKLFMYHYLAKHFKVCCT